MHITNAQQQRAWHAAADYNSSLVKTTRDHTHIDPTDMHQDWDIQPTGNHAVHAGLEGPEHPKPATMDTAYIYSQAGRTMITIPTTRIQWLYQTCMANQNTHPEEHTGLGATYFAADLAVLLSRYKAVQTASRSSPTTPASTQPLQKQPA